jgi:predicted  nucleic acid-binding Zn-ribbon protein
MTEEIEVLWNLRGLDERLVALQGALKRHPADRQSLEARLAGERSKLEGFKKQTGDLQLRHRQIEKDIDALQQEERKFQSQLPMVKKNEEYTALLHEISDRKVKRSARETDLLMLMDEEQRVLGEVPALQKALDAIQAETQARLQAIAAAEQKEREEADELERQRQALVARLSTAMRSRYERIRASKEGRAVVPIIKGSCGGCFRGQPPQMLQEAKRGDRPITCDGCGRLLIWPPDVV